MNIGGNCVPPKGKKRGIGRPHKSQNRSRMPTAKTVLAADDAGSDPGSPDCFDGPAFSVEHVEQDGVPGVEGNETDVCPSHDAGTKPIRVQRSSARWWVDRALLSCDRRNEKRGAKHGFARENVDLVAGLKSVNKDLTRLKHEKFKVNKLSHTVSLRKDTKYAAVVK